MKIISCKVPRFSLKKLIASYEVLDPAEASGVKIIGVKDLAEKDVIVGIKWNTNGAAKLIESYGKDFVTVRGDDKDAAVNLGIEALTIPQFLELLEQEKQSTAIPSRMI